ncbi:hypothetical protein [Magnetofaba australis]|nr:hypothetical protein [Magnetofaba australis]
METGMLKLLAFLQPKIADCNTQLAEQFSHDVAWLSNKLRGGAPITDSEVIRVVSAMAKTLSNLKSQGFVNAEDLSGMDVGFLKLARILQSSSPHKPGLGTDQQVAQPPVQAQQSPQEQPKPILAQRARNSMHAKESSKTRINVAKPPAVMPTEPEAAAEQTPAGHEVDRREEIESAAPPVADRPQSAGGGVQSRPPRDSSDDPAFYSALNQFFKR